MSCCGVHVVIIRRVPEGMTYEALSKKIVKVTVFYGPTQMEYYQEGSEYKVAWVEFETMDPVLRLLGDLNGTALEGFSISACEGDSNCPLCELNNYHE